MDRYVLERLAILVIGFALMLGWSYFLATIGEPQAVWLWRDIFGVQV